MIKATSGQKLQIIIQKRLNLTRVYHADLIRKAANGRHGLKHALIRLMRQSLPERLHSRNWRLQVTPEERRGKSIAQVTDLAQKRHTLQNRQRMTGQQQHHLRRINLLVLPLVKTNSG